MSWTQVFLVIFSIASVVVSVYAIWCVSRASEVTYKPLWIIGSLFGFLGFATTFNSPGDLYLQVGIQIPVLSIFWVGTGETVLKAMFPVVAIVAIVKCHSPGDSPNE